MGGSAESTSAAGPAQPSSAAGAAARGHRALAHTADVVLEAWGPDLATCGEEAIAALIATFTDTVRSGRRTRCDRSIAEAPAESMLLDALDEIIFVLDTASEVPVSARVVAPAGGGMRLTLTLAPRDHVTGTGSVPKAISRSGLTVEQRRGRVWCRFLVDV